MYIATLNFSGVINGGSISRYLPVFDYIKSKKKIAGLILIINSGGGDANATEILYNKLLDVSKSKPVYALIEGIGASGAYWLACAARKIYAMSTSIVGSIGVISISPDVSDFLENLGIKMRINKIGKYKDINSPFRHMNEDENEIFKELLNDVFLRFREEVKKRRNLTDDEINDTATGLVFSARQGLERKLIDGIGTFDTVLNAIKNDNNIKTAKIKNLTPRKPFVQRITGMAFDAFFDKIFNS
ncbi:signal peptide peptidase SppA [Picrophilus oshimae]|uniref:Protease-4 n=1 Tax=Picrophilus torridus (strain ATCC 700027 / DSM 9790 / JCM 10055 / NBRC 100828 / KAW 2/3) TaxID=1122961 RepID=A0A8G2L7X8_PICTO|nr:signal peptide peptidase SppA [Picrophilus oshimae]SMD31557.1 protease-4 [Picrophilus oshimae DSM 9789]